MRNFVFVAILAAASAQAQVVQPLLQNTPASVFTDEDNRVFRDTWNKVLEQADDGTLAWSNPKTGHGGELTPLRSFEWQGNACREVRIRNQAQGRKSDERLHACKIKGEWRLLSAEQLKK